MKRFSLILCRVGRPDWSMRKRTDRHAAALPRGPTLISSASADFDLAGHEATYRGHVRVDDPQMKLTCEKLIADVPAGGRARESHRGRDERGD